MYKIQSLFIRPVILIITYFILFRQENITLARISVEVCIKTFSNRFDLVVVASKRSRQLASGSPMTIDRDNDKNPVVALREISENIVNPKDLEQGIIEDLQKYVEADEDEDEVVELEPSKKKDEEDKSIKILSESPKAVEEKSSK